MNKTFFLFFVLGLLFFGDVCWGFKDESFLYVCRHDDCQDSSETFATKEQDLRNMVKVLTECNYSRHGFFSF